MKPIIHEHTLVCLSSAPSNGNLIRTAAKMRDAFGGSFTALYVQTKGSEQMGDADRQRLQRHIRLAEKLGASISTVSGEDVAYQIAEFARLSKVTKIVIGRSGRLFGQRSLTEKLIELVPYLDIYIIPDITGENKTRRNPSESQPYLPNIQQIGIALAILLISTAIGFLFHSFSFTEANIITIYLLGVLLTALFTRNYFCSSVSSLASVLLFNFFFTEPRLSFYAYESGYPVTFFIMLLAGLITGTLANRLAAHAKQTSQAAWRTKILLDTTQQLQKAANEEEILAVLAAQILSLLNRPVQIRQGDQRILTRFPENVGVFPEEHLHGFEISSGSQAFAEVYLPGPPLEPTESSIIRSILGEGALAMENHRNARQKEAAAVLAKNEQLRANLLRSISHDLRTPLTSISGNAENLLTNWQTMDDATQNATLTDIYDDAIWLNQLVENLLAITKIGEGHTRLRLSTELVEDVITESLRHIRRRNTDHLLEVELSEEFLLAQMDARLISQVIINLVDNAMKYTPAGSCIHIRAQRQGDFIAIRVSDNGPGIPDVQKKKVFEMFYTGDTKVADCRRSMGLGLALCKSIVTIHGGEITLEDHDPTGCIFTFTLPASEVTIYE